VTSGRVGHVTEGLGHVITSASAPPIRRHLRRLPTRRLRELFPRGVDFEYEWAGRESNPVAFAVSLRDVGAAARWYVAK